MKATRVFPAVIIVLQGFALLVCVWKGDWKGVAYWFGAVVINASVI